MQTLLNESISFTFGTLRLGLKLLLLKLHFDSSGCSHLTRTAVMGNTFVVILYDIAVRIHP